VRDQTVMRASDPTEEAVVPGGDAAPSKQIHRIIQ